MGSGNTGSKSLDRVDSTYKMNATDFIMELSQNELEDIAAGSWLSDQVLEFCGY